MKIYFAGAIRGGRNDAKIYEKIIIYLRNIGQVLTEHVGYQDLGNMGEKGGIDMAIYKRDLKWLHSADAIVAEVTTPSLGVGYELGIAEKLKKPVLCLYRPSKGKRLSAMIKGNNQLSIWEYHNITEAQSCIDSFFKNLV
tara:strand:- start:127 stop:546 length:420 start_codon:yes stop_codon:yes gene_type:complete